MIGIEGETADIIWLKARERFLSGDAVEVDSRAGRTLELRPVVFHLTQPTERWVLSRTPALNPAGILCEVIWILAGRNDSRFVNFWNPQLPRFSGKGPIYHGAYGYRLRHAFGMDQLSRAADALAANPDSRQVCLSIWDPQRDMPGPYGCARAEDIPCNVTSLLKVREGRLEWTQVMRSNDFWLGLPFNIIHFTMLQEVLAGWLELEVGSYHHLSDSLHVYNQHREVLNEVEPLAGIPVNTDNFAAVGRLESQAVLGSMIRDVLEPLVCKDFEDLDWPSLMPRPDWPEAYSNLLLVLLADAARRGDDPTRSVELMADCTNPVLQLAWERWMARTLEQETGE